MLGDFNIKILPLSIQNSVANYFHTDARDFAKRFDILWASQLHKTGRIKSFVDLVMGCECSLKCHIFLGRLNEDPDETYRLVRTAGHNVKKLSTMAAFLQNRELYDRVGSKLAPFSVFIRYSLDAYSTFFPALVNWPDAHINHAETIGNNAWVLSVRDDLRKLMDSSSPEFNGIANPDIDAILHHDQKMEEFMCRVAPNKSFKPPQPRGLS